MNQPVIGGRVMGNDPCARAGGLAWELPSEPLPGEKRSRERWLMIRQSGLGWASNRKIESGEARLPGVAPFPSAARRTYMYSHLLHANLPPNSRGGLSMILRVSRNQFARDRAFRTFPH